jgi:hypothetical protein
VTPAIPFGAAILAAAAALRDEDGAGEVDG